MNWHRGQGAHKLNTPQRQEELGTGKTHQDEADSHKGGKHTKAAHGDLKPEEK